MTDPKLLLERHTPRLVYDSMEAYFADSAGIWTDFPSTVLRRAGGAVLAKAPQLSLAFLGAHTYGDGRSVLADDVIGETTRDYQRHAATAHRDVHQRDRIHGHARRDGQGRLWLQYWCFYYYNDFQLAGPFTAGNHEGDWEMVQIRLDAAEKPVQAVYAQHKDAVSRPWSGVRTAPGSADTPLVYVARGSHASYFTPGSHWTGVWFDNADGKGQTIDPALVVLGDAQPGWVAWPGFWGDTKATSSPLDSASPRGPAQHAQWNNPAALVETAARAASAARTRPPAPPLAPVIAARREGDRLVLTYDLGAPSTGLVVATRPAGGAEPAETVAIGVDSAAGEIELPHALGAGAYEVHASATAANGAASPSAATELPPAR
jgi:hypothetical protein